VPDDSAPRRPKSVHEYRKAVLSLNGPKSALARLVALTVAQNMDGKTLESYVGAKRISQEAAMSERAVRTHLAALSRDGWLHEHTKARGRDYWLKVRVAALPANAREPAADACSTEQDATRHPARDAPSRLPAADAGLPANGARHPADPGATACKSLRREPAPSAADLVLASSVRDHVQDLELAGARRVSESVDEWLEKIQRAYPDGLSSADWDWSEVDALCRRRVEQDGATWAQLLNAAQRYASQCEHTKRISTQFVMAPTRFFGEGGEWDKAWTAPPMAAQKDAVELQRLMDSRESRGLAHFPPPHPHDTPATYETKLRLAEQDLPRLPALTALAAMKRRA
jgi:hypothetical protein